jgi:hypothetical protein
MTVSLWISKLGYPGPNESGHPLTALHLWHPVGLRLLKQRLNQVTCVTFLLGIYSLLPGKPRQVLQRWFPHRGLLTSKAGS